jgi:hypothetical protein
MLDALYYNSRAANKSDRVPRVGLQKLKIQIIKHLDIFLNENRKDVDSTFCMHTMSLWLDSNNCQGIKLQSVQKSAPVLINKK